ncbi:MAG: prepilin-type N-terminal cleavage/methylation domain-containing protein [Sulfurovum sp.]|uniref:pilus assembly FimT family protein n=1 Tax=Sulfurovum sp. TaxID=1969726 RepID=UPI0028680061|nr:prepilin-type N-terminal cleavage/methylation domain-containing protein [Sulfurovum sp.]MCO4845827.1 prepilin-type N-terminal cleavage/methylation domain-containing protein [Sulfurovum sp.]
MRTLTKQTKAFTMIELVFVIVVLGILAALALPRMERDLRQEAADNILSAIRYTQHLALNDNKTDPFSGNWQQRFWTIAFTMGTNPYYTVGSDMDNSGGVNKEESAVDPVNGKYMYNDSLSIDMDSDESPDVFIGKKYGINSMSTSAACNQDIGFDHVGRPIEDVASSTNNYSEYMTNDCNLTFNFATVGINPLIITIAKETGHANVVD